MRKRIPYGRHALDENDIQAVVDVLKKGPNITQGKIAGRSQYRHSLFCGENNGTHQLL